MNGLAQSLTLSSSQINFGNVYENAPDSVQITLKNGGIKPVLVTNMQFIMIIMEIILFRASICPSPLVRMIRLKFG
jgi:hypothetical protein